MKTKTDKEPGGRASKKPALGNDFQEVEKLESQWALEDHYADRKVGVRRNALLQLSLDSRLEGFFTDRARTLRREAEFWESIFCHLSVNPHLSIDRLTEQKALATARILKATFEAFYLRDDKGLDELSKGASTVLNRHAKKKFQKDGTTVINRRRDSGNGFRPIFNIGDIPYQKGGKGSGPGSLAESMETTLNNVERLVNKDEISLAAASLVTDMSSPYIAPALSGYGIRLDLQNPQDWGHARAKVIAAFGEVLDRSPKIDKEKLGLAGLRALGFTNHQAHTLVDSGTPEARKCRSDRMRDSRASRKREKG